MKTTPFWTDQTPRPEDIPLSELPGTVDVAVVGSGFTGLNAAITLARAGAKVVVLEQHTLGWGASSRNGGMFATGLKPSFETMEKRYGTETTHAFWQWSLEAVEYIIGIIKEGEIECGLNLSGQLYLACKPEHWDHIQAYVEYISSNFNYHESKLVDSTELENEIGSSAYYGGVVEDLAGGLDPARFTFGLARLASRRGVLLVENAGVSRITKRNGRFSLSTPKGKVKSKEVLLATNGYTTNLVNRVRQGIFPVGSYIIITERLSEALQNELSPKGRIFFDSRFFLNYFWITPSGRMMFGGRSNLSTGLDLNRSADQLRKRMTKIFPQLEKVPITHSWTGKLGISFDQMPHIGRVNGIYYAMGYSGHGLSIGSYMGHEVAKVILGELGSSPFMEIKHPRFVFASWDKFYLPFVTAWFKTIDRFNLL